MVLYVIVWYGMVCHCMVWYSMSLYGMVWNGILVETFFTRVSIMACLYIPNSSGLFSEDKIYGISILKWRVSIPSIAKRAVVHLERGATHLFFVVIHYILVYGDSIWVSQERRVLKGCNLELSALCFFPNC